MAQKNVTVSVNEDMNARWTKVAKKLDLSKSKMIDEYLVSIIPILEAETPNKMMAKAMKKMSNEIDLTGDLFEKL